MLTVSCWEREWEQRHVQLLASDTLTFAADTSPKYLRISPVPLRPQTHKPIDKSRSSEVRTQIHTQTHKHSFITHYGQLYAFNLLNTTAPSRVFCTTISLTDTLAFVSVRPLHASGNVFIYAPNMMAPSSNRPRASNRKNKNIFSHLASRRRSGNGFGILCTSGHDRICEEWCSQNGQSNRLACPFHTYCNGIHVHTSSHHHRREFTMCVCVCASSLCIVGTTFVNAV